MNLQQLRYLVAIHQNNLNITLAARALNASQPGLSRQVKLLEEELGLQLFERAGRTLARTTAAGEEIIAHANVVLREVQNIHRSSEDVHEQSGGTLSIGTTHTQARYVLPSVIGRFRDKYRTVKLQLQQGTSEQIAELVSKDLVDIAIASGSDELFPQLVRLPLFRWKYILVTPKRHPLGRIDSLTLVDIAAHPIVTYAFSLSGRSSLSAQFESAGLSPEIALAAYDSDVVKTYVRAGLGVGILASLAVDPVEDRDLKIIDVGHLFDGHLTWLGFRRHSYLRRYVYDFIRLLAPHLTRKLVREAESLKSQEDLHRLFSDLALPTR